MNNYRFEDLKIGQVLKIPVKDVKPQNNTNTYTVKSGDTIFMGNNEYIK